MINTKLIDNIIRVGCSKDQPINSNQLKQTCRTCFQIMEDHGNVPIIINAENNVQLSPTAKKIFKRLNNKYDNITLVVISG